VRAKKLYLIAILFATHSFASELKSTVKCFEAEGLLKKNGNQKVLYLNYKSSSERQFKIITIDKPEDLEMLSQAKVSAQFTVNEDCFFQCNITLKSIKIIEPWKKIDPIAHIAKCKGTK
jgi:hypothetical protein